MSTTYMPPAPGPQAPKAKRWPVALGTVLGVLVGLFFGFVGGSASTATTTTAVDLPTPSVTVTQHDIVEKPGPTVTATVEVPGPTVTVTAKPKGPSGTIASDGTWLVGKDIKPGTYRATGGTCYWERLSGTSGDFDDIIANGNGPSTVTIKSGDNAFHSERCAPWERIR